MNRRKRVVFGVLGGVIALAAIFAFIFYRYSINKKQAIQAAQIYLEQKYPQEMEYRSIFPPLLDLAIYRVSFSPIDNPDFIFTVMVQMDFTMKESHIVNNRHYMQDNYDMVYFQQQMADHLNGSVQDMWGSGARPYVTTYNDARAAYVVPVGLYEQTYLAEKEALIDEYWIHINTATPLNEKNILIEAENILTFIQSVRQSGYEPDDIIVRYVAPKTFKDNSGLTVIGFEDWQTITTIEPIVEQLKASLAK